MIVYVYLGVKDMAIYVWNVGQGFSKVHWTTHCTHRVMMDVLRLQEARAKARVTCACPGNISKSISDKGCVYRVP